MTQLRIWAEELHPDPGEPVSTRPEPEEPTGQGTQEQTFRLSWQWEEDAGEHDLSSERESVAQALLDQPGIHSAQPNDEGVVVTIDPDEVTRKAIAVTIRETLDADEPPPSEAIDPDQIRIWAEELEGDAIRLTWRTPDAMGERDFPTDRRAVAARIGIQPGVYAARTDPEGVVVRYDSQAIERPQIAALVRQALSVEQDLKTRANLLVKRTPAYGRLARTAAADERMSPLPDAARQAFQNRGNPATTAATRMIPGFRLISRIQTLLPVIQALSQWSREAPPEVVDDHLARAGLTRQILEEDHVTAQEAKLFAREIAGEKAEEWSQKAASATARAINAGREWLDQRRELDDDEPPRKRRDTDEPHS